MQALDEPSPHVASYAAEGVAGVRQLAPRDVESFKAWLDDHPGEWRLAGPLLAALARSGEGPYILEWLARWGEEDVMARTRGLGALAFVPGEEATQALMDAARSPQSRVRGTALGGLARRWRGERSDPARLEAYFQVFSEGLGTRDLSAVVVAAPALADSAFLPMGSLDLLMEEYGRMALPDDLEGMQAILQALGETGTPEAEGFLRREMGRVTGALRESAVRALSALMGEEPDPSRVVQPTDREVDWGALAALGPRPRVLLETEKGSVTLVLDTESAPLTVQTIAGFVQDGLFDGVPFHRVVPNFVVQGGDFTRKDGFGGPGFTIRSEFTQLSFRRGVLGMASAGKDTEGSQFFITHSMQPHLDGGYTSFGWVEQGMDVVDRIHGGDLILTARLEPGSS
jgi:peptidylprolyl isomerase